MKKPMTIRTMTRADLNLAIDWAAEEGWNPGLCDALPFWAADPAGFLIGEIEGQAVAVISAVRYGQDFGFIGFYIVKPAYRGQGYGWAIWQAALQHLQGRTVGLDGVLAQQENYQRSGFVLAHRNIRYAGVGSVLGAGQASVATGLLGCNQKCAEFAVRGELVEPQAPVSASSPSTGSGRTEAETRPSLAPGLLALGEIPFALLLEYDRRCFPAAREAFLRTWIAQPGTQAYGVLAGQCLVGYGVIRPCRSGFKIGPLLAGSPDVAEAIFAQLHQFVPAGTVFYLDVMGSAPPALELVAGHGMQPVFETARMYLGPAPDVATEQIYGITSFELG